MEKVSELIAGIDPVEIIVPFLLMEFKNYGKTMNNGKNLVLISWKKLIAIIPKVIDLTL